jgi:dipeptidyl aminopeptidase/acylaminoacyl peptidase
MKKSLIAIAVGTGALAAGIVAWQVPARAQESRDIVVTARIPAILLNGAKPEIAAGVGTAPTSWFRRISSLQDPELSPDGTKLALRMANQGRAYIAWIDLTSTSRAPNFFAAMNEYRDAGDRTITGFRWVGNDTIVYSTAERADLGQRVDFTRLVAYNIGTRATTRLAWDEAGQIADDVLYTDHDNGRLLVQRSGLRDGDASQAEVVSVDVRTGRYTMVQRENPEVQGWSADSSGVVRLGSSYDRRSGRTRILYRRSASDQFRTLTNEADPTFTDAGLNVLWIDPNSDNAIVRDNKDGFHRLYRVNLSTLTYGPAIFQRPGYDVGGVLTNFDGSQITGFSATEQRFRRIYTDATMRELQTVLDETFGEGNAGIVSRDRASRKFIINAGATNQAGAFYIFDSQTGQMTFLGNEFGHLGMTQMNPVSTFRYTASDGQSIEAVLTMPRHRRQTRNLPMVIIPHGGPFGVRDEERFDSWAQSIAELGYVVVQPNYRGSGGYGRQFQQIGRDNGFGLRMQDDLNDVITHMARDGTVDANRVCMMGWSYGGYASARAAQRDPDKYRCTIAGAGVYDLAAMRAYDVGYLGNFGSNYLAKGAAELNAVSPTRNAGGRWAPILIVHGVRDQRVPIAQGRGLVSALRAAGKVQGTDFDYIEQPQNTHNLIYDDVYTEWLEGAAGWLARWNPAYIDSDTDRPVPTVPEGERPQPRRN